MGTTRKFFATAIYPVGPIRGEVKLGVIASGIGILATLLLAWWNEPRRLRTRLHPGAADHRPRVA